MIPFDQAAGIATICILTGGTLGWWLHAANVLRIFDEHLRGGR